MTTFVQMNPGKLARQSLGFDSQHLPLVAFLFYLPCGGCCKTVATLPNSGVLSVTSLKSTVCVFALPCRSVHNEEAIMDSKFTDGQILSYSYGSFQNLTATKCWRGIKQDQVLYCGELACSLPALKTHSIDRHYICHCQYSIVPLHLS